jgi:outer membrane immunogenic protein
VKTTAALSSAILASSALATFAIAASAADLPLKAPPNSPPLAASPWSGFYLGGGIGFQSSALNETSGIPAGFSSLAASSEPLNGVAFRGNAFAGYNFQVTSRWVLGVEGDFGSTNQTTTFPGIAFPFPFAGTTLFAAGDSIAAKTTWDGSARGRVGFLVAPGTLVYATGGAAWQHYAITTTCGSSFCSASPILSGGFLIGGGLGLSPAVTNSAITKTGWTLGGGIETALGGHWFARADYRFADFGDSNFSITRVSPFLSTIVNPFDVTLRTHTVNFGLAYKFGDEVVSSAAPAEWLALPVKASAKAPASPSWSGLYAGLGLGVRASGTDATTTSTNDPGLGFEAGRSSSGAPVNGTALRGSPYLGVNWQIAPRWVVGIEADVGFAGQTTSLPGLSFSPGIDAQSFFAGDSFAVRTKWDASARGRVGFLATPATLLYVTGGAAWQRFEVTSTCNVGGGNGCGNLIPAVFTNAATKAGWTAGAGIETSVGGNWFARAEYRYADFGPSGLIIQRATEIDNFDVALRTHTATFGLAYKFGNLTVN